MSYERAELLTRSLLSIRVRLIIPSVARQHGARVCEMAWEDDFSGAQFALGQASGEWILVLKCDETLSPIDEAACKTVRAKKGTVMHIA